jgi:hypothetical protein
MVPSRKKCDDCQQEINGDALDGIHTPDHRYLVVRGRLWRATNPELPAEERERLTTALMSARRAVGRCIRAGDLAGVADARRRVDRSKRALGERGPVWWTDGAPDYNRRLAVNTPYAEWYRVAETLALTMVTLLGARGEEASICPSDVARAAEPRHWRAHMDATREVARHLSRHGVIAITQRGRPVDPDAPFKGPVRLALPVTE